MISYDLSPKDEIVHPDECSVTSNPSFSFGLNIEGLAFDRRQDSTVDLEQTGQFTALSAAATFA